MRSSDPGTCSTWCWTACDRPATRLSRLLIIEFLTAKWDLREFDEHGFMRRREASINDLAIDESQRRIFGPRPLAERGTEFPLQ